MSDSDPQRTKAVAQELLTKLRHDRLAVFQLSSLPPLIFYVYRAHSVGMQMALYSVLVGLANNLFNIWLLHRSPWPQLAAPIYISGLYLIVGGVAFLDGLVRSSTLWFVMLGPILAALTMNRRAVKVHFWVALSVVMLVSAAQFGFEMPAMREHPPKALWIMRLVVLLMLSGFGLIAVWRTSRLEREIEAQNESQEEARKEVAAAAASKTEFLATMSHEIRTPMNGILGTAQHLAGCGLDDRQRGYASLILDSGHRLMDVLNAILDLSKIEANKFELRDTGVRLDRVFRDVVAEVRRSVYAQRLTLVARGGEEPLLLRGDPSRIEQVLRNLLVAMVELAQTDEVQVELFEAGDTVCIEIWVCGTSLDDAALTVLREPALALSMRPEHGQSAALAMRVSYAIVALMGGVIEVQPCLARGTVLTWGLCSAEVQHASELSLSAGVVEQSLEDLEAHEVMVVDDNAINLRVARMQLEQLGCSVTIASDGQQAVELSQTRTFAAIFMDLQMPKMGGVQATQEIRAGQGPNVRTPIIAFTADAYDADLEALEAAGMNGHLTKPFRVEALRRVLSRLTRPSIERRAG